MMAWRTDHGLWAGICIVLCLAALPLFLVFAANGVP